MFYELFLCIPRETKVDPNFLGLCKIAFNDTGTGNPSVEELSPRMPWTRTTGNRHLSKALSNSLCEFNACIAA